MATIEQAETIEKLNEKYRQAKNERACILTGPKRDNGGEWPADLKSAARDAGLPIVDYVYAEVLNDEDRALVDEMTLNLSLLSDKRRLLRKPSRQKQHAEQEKAIRRKVAEMSEADKEALRKALD